MVSLLNTASHWLSSLPLVNMGRCFWYSGHINDPPALEDNRPALDDGTGDSSSPNSTKRRRLSTKASEGAFSAVENNRKESSNVATTISVEQDRKDARHRATLELDAKKHRELLELEARKHQDKIIIEKEKLQRSAALGQGYIAALLSIADGLKVIGDALKKPWWWPCQLLPSMVKLVFKQRDISLRCKGFLKVTYTDDLRGHMWLWLRGCLVMLLVHSFEYLLPSVFLGGGSKANQLCFANLCMLWNCSNKHVQAM